MRPINKLLVSVRNAAEADAALAGGADLIDIKEPANGPLGRADECVIGQIIEAVAGRAPVSAACGELRSSSPQLPAGLSFAKFGLANWRHRNWIDALRAIPLANGCGLVAVAYADWKNCNAPSPKEVAAAAIEHRFAAFLIDTHDKNGLTLLDHLPPETIADLTHRCQSAGIPVALAGSLGVSEVMQLLDITPDWFAVRGAACDNGRNGAISEKKVREIRAPLRRLRVAAKQPPNYLTTQPPNYPTT
jgi:uncharacterized protein (UPF0264 family)